MKTAGGILLLLLCVLAGCSNEATSEPSSPSNSQSLVGTWTDSSGSGTVTFKADGTYTMEAETGSVKAVLLGTYKVETDRISMTAVALKGTSEESATTPLKDEPAKVSKIEWKSDNEVVMSPVEGGPTTVLRRKV